MEFLRKKIRGFFAEYAVLPFGQGAIMIGVGFVSTVLLTPPIFVGALEIALFTSPLWITYKLKDAIMYYWVHYIQHDWLDKEGQRATLWEIRLPPNIEKSPRAMEMVYQALFFKPQYSTMFQKKWKGHVMPWYSLEVVYTNQRLRFYIWGWKRLWPRIEGAFYSQYPDVQIVEVEDYAAHWKSWGLHNSEVWGCSYKLQKPEQFPIKTYIDWDLDKDPKEEQRTDPMTTILEIITSVYPTETVAFQIMIQPDISEGWKAKMDGEIKKIYEKSRQNYNMTTKDGEVREMKGFSQLRPLDYELVRSMERQLTKHSYNVGIRGIYVAPKGKFFTAHASPVVQHIWNAINSRDSDFYNTITADPEYWLMGFDWPWEDWTLNWPPGWKGVRRRGRASQLFQAWAARSYFYPPFIQDPMNLTVEELATIFHFPGSEANVPGLKRIESHQGAAPVNLPVE